MRCGIGDKRSISRSESVIWTLVAAGVTPSDISLLENSGYSVISRSPTKVPRKGVKLSPNAARHFKGTQQLTSYVRGPNGQMQKLLRQTNSFPRQNPQKAMMMSVAERLQALIRGVKTESDPELNVIMRHMPRRMAQDGVEIKSRAIRNMLEEAASFSVSTIPIDPDEAYAIMRLAHAFKIEKRSYKVTRRNVDVEPDREVDTTD